MDAEPPTIPDDLSFEAAIALTQSLLDQQYQGKSSEAATAAGIRALVGSENGARGFFVTYLSDPRSAADQLLPVVAQALVEAPLVVSPLLVKNLAMSTAMGIHHRRNQNEELAAGSDRVRSRTVHLLQLLSLPEIRVQVRSLTESLQSQAGEYQAFLQRWGYDAEQRAAISQVLEQLGEF
jgi:hypothetical protein